MSEAAGSTRREEDLSSLDVSVLLERLLELDRAQSALHARSSRLLAEVDRRAFEVGAEHVVLDPRAARESERDADREAAVREQLGARLIVAEIAVARRVSESSVRAQLDEATRLARLPSALAALDDGAISPAHARALADGVTEVPQGTESEFERLVLPTALHGTPAQIRRRARAVRERLHPLSIDIRAARRREERRVAFEADRDGMAWLHLCAPCVEVRGAYERVDAAARALAAASDEHRSIAQIRADVAADLLLHGDVHDAPAEEHDSNSGRHDTLGTQSARDSRAVRTPAVSRGSRRPAGRYSRFRPTVRVTVPALTLLGRSEEPAVLEGYGPIPTAVAEDLAASAPSFLRILTHPETGTVVSVGRSSYAVPADLRRLVQLRDVRCRFPGCERGADRCDIDHTRSWEHGGQTSLDNLACLCRGHHRLKHQTSWQVSRPPGTGAALVWTSPLGRTVRDSPDPPF
ncbi:HNH endonuclease signature motif containing protein [Labedella gwakjiensis]|uniref:HNH endonuclease signature motif containing protein n=1 Tax=Labedella gwakjiensis TaxID=390269 RepID=UPI001FB794CE|nr:HNH endonuclease signature motif containing protein [Labedella gwakjiensis]